MLSLYQTCSPLPQTISGLSITPPGQKGIESGQKGSKVNIYLLDFVSPREFRRQQTAKFKIYLSFEGTGASVVALSLGRWWCPLVAGGALLLPLFGCVPTLCPSFVPCLLCLWCIAFEYGSISRFKGVFRGFWGADVCLYGFGALLGLCGFCARVELGGYMTCGVFASILSLLPMFYLFCIRFSSSSPFFCPLSCPLCSCFLCLSSCPLLVLSLCGLLFLFPYGCMRKKKGRKVLSFASSHGVLLSRSNSCNVVKKLRCRCFGFFQFVRFILPANTTGVRRLAGSHLNPFRHNVNITDNPPAFLK